MTTTTPICPPRGSPIADALSPRLRPAYTRRIFIAWLGRQINGINLASQFLLLGPLSNLR